MRARFRHPPRWAEAILHRRLASRDRYTITGDLLEEYREEILPARGGFRAALWYWWQTLTLVVFARRQRKKSGHEPKRAAVVAAGWGYVDRLAACSRTAAISPGTQQAIEAMRFDPAKPIAVTGVITTFYWPSGGSGLMFLKADVGYILRLGTTRFTTDPGEKVVVTGLGASEGKQIDGVSVAQAFTVKTLDGRTVFDRSGVE